MRKKNKTLKFNFREKFFISLFFVVIFFILGCGNVFADATDNVRINENNYNLSEYNTLTFLDDSFDLTLSKNGKLTVNEKTHVYFPNDSYSGIYVRIPWSKDDFSWVNPVNLLSICYYPYGRDSKKDCKSYKSYFEGGDYILKIGDPDAKVTGVYVYEISYIVNNVSFSNKNGDVFGFNIIGTSSENDILKASFNLYFENIDIDLTKDGGTTFECYTGVSNSKDKNCRLEVSGDSLKGSVTKSLLPNEGFSIFLYTKHDVLVDYNKDCVYPDFCEYENGKISYKTSDFSDNSLISSIYNITTKSDRFNVNVENVYYFSSPKALSLTIPYNLKDIAKDNLDINKKQLVYVKSFCITNAYTKAKRCEFMNLLTNFYGRWVLEDSNKELGLFKVEIEYQVFKNTVKTDKGYSSSFFIFNNFLKSNTDFKIYLNDISGFLGNYNIVFSKDYIKYNDGKVSLERIDDDILLVLVNHDKQIRFNSISTYFFYFMVYIFPSLGFLIPVPVFLLSLLIWLYNGKDIKPRAIVPIYRPIEGLDPMVAGLVLTMKYNIKYVTALIIDLAIRGYLKVEQIDDKNYSFINTFKIDEGRENLKEYELDILKGLFGDNLKKSSASLKSDLKYNFFDSSNSALKNAMKYCVKDLKYFEGNPISKVALFSFISFPVAIIMLCSLFVFRNQSFFWGLIISLFVISFFAVYMGKRTKAGALIYEQILGLKLYIDMAEEERIKYFNNPDNKEKIKVFEKLLPYAIIFGLEKKWLNEFKDLFEVYKENQSWYIASSMSGFNSNILINSLSSLNSSLVKQGKSIGVGMSSSGSSFGGSGGFGGGGFGSGSSGGGFGGGSKGGW